MERHLGLLVFKFILYSIILNPYISKTFLQVCKLKGINSKYLNSMIVFANFCYFFFLFKSKKRLTSGSAPNQVPVQLTWLT